MKTLVKTNGHPALQAMMEDFWNTDRFFDKAVFSGGLLPAVNIRETKHHYQLEVAVPGFKKDDFKITTEDGILTISAETSKDEKEEKEGYTRREFSCASFSRSFKLPDNVEEDAIHANYQNGLLELELKRTGKNQTARKEVKID